jgi:hypothetical protein
MKRARTTLEGRREGCALSRAGQPTRFRATHALRGDAIRPVPWEPVQGTHSGHRKTGVGAALIAPTIAPSSGQVTLE